jgi:hypothetical protein
MRLTNLKAKQRLSIKTHTANYLQHRVALVRINCRRKSRRRQGIDIGSVDVTAETLAEKD